jgi:ethanolamine utilization protein EutA (predicted chaperonin)
LPHPSRTWRGHSLAAFVEVVDVAEVVVLETVVVVRATVVGADVTGTEVGGAVVVPSKVVEVKVVVVARAPPPTEATRVLGVWSAATLKAAGMATARRARTAPAVPTILRRRRR